MKKSHIYYLTACMTLLSQSAISADQLTQWYSLSDDLTECIRSVSPAQAIQDLYTKKLEFSVEELRDTKGQLLRVTVKNSPDTNRYTKKTFYKSADDCKVALEKVIPESYK